MGFQLIVYPLAALFASARAIHTVYAKLLRDGTTFGAGTEAMSFDEFNALIGVEERYAMAERFGVQ
jgi:2-methylisocitrate lyase-like PEP mutase family enzyme